MITFRIDHLHLICEDLQEMIRFWTQGLGASFKQYQSFGGADGAVVLLDNLQINLRLSRPDEQSLASGTRPMGYDHLGFWVDHLDSACEHLAQFGCAIHSGPSPREDRTIVFLKGPEGITFELMQKH